MNLIIPIATIFILISFLLEPDKKALHADTETYIRLKMISKFLNRIGLGLLILHAILVHGI